MDQISGRGYDPTLRIDTLDADEGEVFAIGVDRRAVSREPEGCDLAGGLAPLRQDDFAGLGAAPNYLAVAGAERFVWIVIGLSLVLVSVGILSRVFK